jgi:hypothetical protein
MERETIVEELLAQARTYLDENSDMIIKTLQVIDDIPQTCTKCKGNLVEIYSRLEKPDVEETAVVWDAVDLVVYRCENCKLVHAFWILTSSFDDSLLTPAKEDEHLGGRILEPPKWQHVGDPRWGEGTPPKYPKKLAKAYERTVSQMDDFNRRLNNVLQDKFAKIYNAGINSQIINVARNKVCSYFGHSSLTGKQLTSNEQGLDTNKKISERQIEKIFEVTRKTIRKWKKTLLRESL